LNNPLISIIIPVYNRESLIVDTLDSILKQSYSNWECIIIDDFSTDNTKPIIIDFIKNDKRFVIADRPISKKKGASACRNYGYTISSGDYICWFDSDDIMPFNSLDDRINILYQNDCDFVLGKVTKFNHFTKEIISEISSIELPITNNPAAEYLLGNFWFQTSSPVFRKSFLEKFKYHFDESLTFNDETEFYVRLLLSNPIIKSVKTVVTLRRMHDESLKSGVYSMPLAERILFDQFAYFKIWLHFKKNKIFYNYDIHEYFKYYFKYWIVKMKFSRKRLIFLYLNGLHHSMFENKIEISRILIWRLSQKK
jgi:glycosyltransferase involved in cell wall biosynthesis